MLKIINFCILISLLQILKNTNAWKIFWKGRKFDGNLGEPTAVETFNNIHVTTDWFDQFLNHFDPEDSKTFKQLYYVNDEFYKKGGPIFLMIGGEGPTSEKWMKKGAWVHYAQGYDALLFQLEHRFYGKTHPTPDLSTENLLHLSSEQALADIAYFVVEMNKKYNLDENVKWIAFGGSYPGSLAAWLREKYPHLVHGAVSSSGPLLAKADFTEYYDVVIDSLATHSDNCVDVVQKSFQYIELLLKQPLGQQNLYKKFKLCDPIEESIENSNDISMLFATLAEIFAEIVQYNKDNRANADITIDTICDILINKTIGTPVDRLAAVSNLLLKQNKEVCLDYKYDKMISDMQAVQWRSKVANGMRQWTYQTCTEFGFYQTSNNKSSVFGDKFQLDWFIKQCSDIFGSKFDEKRLNNSIYRTNTYYGALHPQTTNVIYVHGSIDPWHALGLTKSDNPQMPTIYIEGTAHCANMYEPQEGDARQLKDARIKIKDFLDSILK